MPCLFLKLISVCLHRFSADTVGACHLPEQSALLHQVSATSWSVCALWECVNLFHHRLEGWIKVGLLSLWQMDMRTVCPCFQQEFDLFFCYQTLLKQAVHSIFQPSVIGCFYSWPFPLVYINVEGGGNSEWWGSNVVIKKLVKQQRGPSWSEGTSTEWACISFYGKTSQWTMTSLLKLSQSVSNRG